MRGVRAGLLTLSVLFVAVIVASLGPSRGSAVGGTVAVLPPLDPYGGTVFDFGLHFDEGGLPTFGGYDYSYTNMQEWSWSFIRSRADGSLSAPFRYQYWRVDDCKVRVRPQKYVFGSWASYWQYDQHFIHIYSGTDTVYYTSVIQSNGDSLSSFVGYVYLCSLTQGLNAHLSSELAYGVTVTSKSGDTCWQNASGCYWSLGQVRKHVSGSSCPPGQTSGTATRSGVVNEYVCETWSVRSGSKQDAAFRIP